MSNKDNERLRKTTIAFLKDFAEQGYENAVECIDWLENQGEKTNPYSGISFEYNGHIWGMCARDNGVDILLDKQLFKHLEEQGEEKPSDNIEPKFKVGDWIVDNCNNLWKIVGIMNGFYILEDGDEGGSRPTIEWVDKTFHLWDIAKDAKDGDVIFYDSGWTCIFECIHGMWYSSYCFITADGEFHTSYEQHYVGAKVNGNAHPATKEQCDTLLEAMAEAGYTFDFDKKELKKIEQNLADNIEPKFHEGEWIIIK